MNKTHVLRFSVGQWVYSHYQGFNVRVVSARVESLPFSTQRIDVPGISAGDSEFGQARDGAEFREFIQTEPHSWAPVHGPHPRSMEVR